MFLYDIGCSWNNWLRGTSTDNLLKHTRNDRWSEQLSNATKRRRYWTRRQIWDSLFSSTSEYGTQYSWLLHLVVPPLRCHQGTKIFPYSKSLLHTIWYSHENNSYNISIAAEESWSWPHHDYNDACDHSPHPQCYVAPDHSLQAANPETNGERKNDVDLLYLMQFLWLCVIK